MPNYVYPITKCLHPKTIKNPYTGQIIRVGCGVCKACMLNRHRKMSMLCSFEETDYKYCMFATLTYSDENLPKIRMVETTLNHYALVDITRRSKTYLQNLGEISIKPHEYSLLQQKLNLKESNILPIVSKRDCQLFLKRFRKNIFSKTNEKIRYYAVAEYGPVHFRPHYHFLFFFDSDEVFQVFGQSLRESWKYGYIDFSKSRSNASSYVAGYVNSSIDLPAIYTSAQARPFSLHSQFFALGLYKSKAKEIYEDSNYNIVYQSRPVGRSFIDYNPWRSFTSYFFPKCVGFGQKSRREIYASYRLIQVARFYYGNDTTAYQAALAFCSCEDSAPLLSAYFRSSLPQCFYLDDSDKYFNRVFHELSVSAHFVDFVCKYFDSFDSAFDRIMDFYNWRDYDNLKNFYFQQEQLSIDPKFGVEYLPNLYDNYDTSKSEWVSNTFVFVKVEDVKPIEQSDYYTLLCVDTSVDFEKSIKHKRLNDLNKLFINNLNN